MNSSWLTIALGIAGTLNAPAVTSAASQPNILLIVADDLGWNDVGYHNSRMRTPTLDRIAAEGVRLNWHYVTTECTPTRVCLMTGRHPSRFGPHCTHASNEQAFTIGTPTLASVLKSAGYETAIVGKWHLGSKPEWGPNHHGFDHSYGSLAGAVGMYDHRYRLGSPFEKTWHRNHEFLDAEEGHATDLVTAEAVRLIEQPRERPFFLYVPFHSVHTPLVEEQKYLDRVSHIEHADRRLYAAAVNHLDDSIGKLLEALRQNGQLESTLIVFTSDNGAQVHHGGDQYPPPDPKLEHFSSNKPLRGRKTEVYEGGIRVPALVYWPGTLAPQVCEAPLHAVDWLPTLAKLAGTQAPQDASLDGIDAWPQLSGKAGEQSPRTLYWNRSAGNQRRTALRHGDWKLLRPDTDAPWELYNLADDPYETTNLVAKEPGQVQELQVLFSVQQAKDARIRTATPAAPASP